MGRKVKDVDVQYLHQSFKPEAQCLGKFERNDAGELEQTAACAWLHVPHVYSLTGDAKKGAKAHVKACPGHQVEVIQRNHSLYRVEPNDLV